MNIYWKQLGQHIHMRLFMNGAKMGDLCVRADEWERFRGIVYNPVIKWIEEDRPLIVVE